jgi:hypothetical protein
MLLLSAQGPRRAAGKAARHVTFLLSAWVLLSGKGPSPPAKLLFDLIRYSISDLPLLFPAF